MLFIFISNNIKTMTTWSRFNKSMTNRMYYKKTTVSYLFMYIYLYFLLNNILIIHLAVC